MAEKEAEATKTVAFPVGELIATEKKDDSGKLVGMTYRGSTADLHAWEEKNFGIDDKIRKALEDRNNSLAELLSDFTTERCLEHRVPIDVNLGMGNGAQLAHLNRFSKKHYPIKNEDETYSRGEKTVYGDMEWKTQQVIPRAVREHHAANQKRIEEQVLSEMDKASIK